MGVGSPGQNESSWALISIRGCQTSDGTDSGTPVPVDDMVPIQSSSAYILFWVWTFHGSFLRLAWHGVYSFLTGKYRQEQFFCFLASAAVAPGAGLIVKRAADRCAPGVPQLRPEFHRSNAALDSKVSVHVSDHAANQVKVYDCIRAHPGIHLRQISRELALGIGDVQYHLYRLEKDGSIRSVRRGLYRFFYPADLFGEMQSSILGALSLETPRELLLNVIELPDSTQEELSKLIGLSPPTISWHMKRLVDLGIIERRQRGRSVSYRVVGDAGEIANFVRNYHPTVWERWSSRLADLVIGFSGEEGRNEE
jgi:DNA-binding MarR family transcriptional regulator